MSFLQNLMALNVLYAWWVGKLMRETSVSQSIPSGPWHPCGMPCKVTLPGTNRTVSEQGHSSNCESILLLDIRHPSIHLTVFRCYLSVPGSDRH
jgi:hypothetical protein